MVEQQELPKLQDKFSIEDTEKYFELQKQIKNLTKESDQIKAKFKKIVEKKGVLEELSGHKTIVENGFVYQLQNRKSFVPDITAMEAVATINGILDNCYSFDSDKFEQFVKIADKTHSEFYIVGKETTAFYLKKEE